MKTPCNPPNKSLSLISIILFVLCSTVSQISHARCISGNCISGRGTYKYPSGNEYSGSFHNGRRHGQGIFTWVDGYRYIGEYQNGNMHGVGMFVFPNGEKYEGEYENNMRNGYGVYTWLSGASYSGQYKNGKKNGVGKFTFANGVVLNGVWKDDQLTESGFSNNIPPDSAKEFSLTINTVPPNANINFIDSQLVYSPGIKLKPGRYQVEVSHKNYKTTYEVIDILDQDVKVPVFLQVNEIDNPPLKSESVVTLEKPLPPTSVNRAIRVDAQHLDFQKLLSDDSVTSSQSAEERRQFTEQRINTSIRESNSSQNISMVEQVKQEIDLIKSSFDSSQSLLSLEEIPIQNATPTKKTALVIGNSNYPVLGQLKNPENDARDMGDTLRAAGFNVILKLNASQEDIEDGIVEFGKRIKEDGGIGLFYYAGHGVQLQGFNYLVPIASRIKTQKDIRYKAVNVNLVIEEIIAAKNEINIIIVDACRNNPLPKGRGRDKIIGLARTEVPEGTLIAYATSPGSVAKDGEGRNGVYTKHLLQNMKAPNVPIETMFKRIMQGVMMETDRQQIPWMTSSLTKNFYFTQGYLASSN
ncbi:MAG: caspase family protein [Gammaproteobacteria bacterium]